MTRKNKPKFPADYKKEKAEEYDNLSWMERNQKKSTLLSIQFLFDEKLDSNKNSLLEKDKSFLVLDLGCGTGFSSEVLVENGFRVIGVDVLLDMLSKAREKKVLYQKFRNLDLVLADITFLPFRNNTMNFIISISAYNFIIQGRDNFLDKTKLLNNTAKSIKKILKKKGRIIIEFYPENEKELNLFNKSFINNGFEGFLVKNNPRQKSGQTFLLLKKKT
ncbi:hypothetical protein LCGC14_1457630 [marine sediment metagenome]|uniref:Methyltransferase type 11 domain-containing protein n=1 Tax=marine sediment metagenome TaxID=412755 RepID=A0A0F9LWQ1_9ZZZZ